MRILIFALFIYNCLSFSFTNQMDYFENERIMFHVPKYEKPYNYTEITTKRIDQFPLDETFVTYMQSIADKVNHMEATKDTPIIGNNYLIRIASGIWRWLGWQHQTHYDEEYWFYNNTKTNNTVFFFHGINGMDGLENTLLLNQLKRNASIYFPIHKQAFLLHHPCDKSFSDHIDNIIQFVKTFQNKETIAFVGNSYGSIRATTICRRIDCSGLSKIILTDPLHVNLPYSEMAKHVLYGVFLEHESSSWRTKFTTVRALRSNKQRSSLERNFNIKEWTMDTPFMEKYKHNLILVIGLKDNLISVDKDSYAMTQLCKVIYTNTIHGMVLFSRFLDRIKVF
jgi:hypothetical protein